MGRRPRPPLRDMSLLQVGRTACLTLVASLLVLGSAPVTPMTDHIEVNLVLYSGRPDPGWTITQPEAIAHIQQSLQQLPEAAPPQWPALGWRGFLLKTGSSSLLPGIVRVFQGTVCVTDDNGRRCYVDRNHLEDWLRAEANRNGLGKFLPPSK